MTTPEILAGDIVLSCRGRDAGRIFLVLSAGPEGLLLSDGRMRRAERPKRKKAKHVQRIPVLVPEDKLFIKLRTGEKLSNREVRKILDAAVEAEGVGGTQTNV